MRFVPIILLLGLTGCATVSPGNPKLQVAIPTACEELAKEVSAPALREGDKALAALARTRAALGMANGNIRATRDCQASQRGRFANGG